MIQSALQLRYIIVLLRLLSLALKIRLGSFACPDATSAAVGSPLAFEGLGQEKSRGNQSQCHGERKGGTNRFNIGKSQYSKGDGHGPREVIPTKEKESLF